MTGSIRQYSGTGIYHLMTGQGNQDALISSENERYTAIVLADGVSSCSKAEEGAGFIARITSDHLMKNAKKLFGWNEEWIRESVADEIRRRLSEYVSEAGGDIPDYSSTLAFVLADRSSRKAICLSLGDGLILSVSSKCCRIELQPCITPEGCFVTTTEGFERVTRCRIIDTDAVNSLCICSDGAWRAMYKRTKMKKDIRLAFMRDDMSYIFRCLDESSLYDDHSMICTQLTPCPTEYEFT